MRSGSDQERGEISLFPYLEGMYRDAAPTTERGSEVAGVTRVHAHPRRPEEGAYLIVRMARSASRLRTAMASASPSVFNYGSRVGAG